MLPFEIRVGVGVIQNMSYCFYIRIEPKYSLNHGCLWFLSYNGLELHIVLPVCRLSFQDQCFGRHGTADRKAESNRSKLLDTSQPKASFASGPHKPSRKLADTQYHTTNNAHIVILRRPSVVL